MLLLLFYFFLLNFFELNNVIVDLVFRLYGYEVLMKIIYLFLNIIFLIYILILI